MHNTPATTSERRRHEKHRRAVADANARAGRRLKQIRRERKLSQQAIARMLGISFQQVQKYEQSIDQLSAGAVYRLAEMLGIEIGSFFE
ncbi:MAG: helix-turn-helix transcriptional regulator [Planctomycetota bacterium]